jgi:hypothetical protein
MELSRLQKWYEWGSTFCLKPEQVSCLWHWPSGLCTRNGAVKGPSGPSYGSTGKRLLSVMMYKDSWV